VPLYFNEKNGGIFGNPLCVFDSLQGVALVAIKRKINNKTRQCQSYFVSVSMFYLIIQRDT
jgi:hypothetical protein